MMESPLSGTDQSCGRQRQESISSSLEDEMHSLLQECQDARQRAQAEIGRALEALRRTSPAWTCFPPDSNRHSLSGSPRHSATHTRRDTEYMASSSAQSRAPYRLYQFDAPSDRHSEWPPQVPLAACRLSTSHSALHNPAAAEAALNRETRRHSGEFGRHYSFGNDWSRPVHFAPPPAVPTYFQAVSTPQRLPRDNDSDEQRPSTSPHSTAGTGNQLLLPRQRFSNETPRSSSSARWRQSRRPFVGLSGARSRQDTQTKTDVGSGNVDGSLRKS